jgi:outer membrane receptor protein involved in Fe transport
MKNSSTKLLLAVFAIFAFASTAFAQLPTARLSGRVSDADQAGIPGVTVSVSAPELQGVRTVVTDANGEYLVASVPPGDYTFTFSLDGFETQTRTLKLSSAQVQRLDVDMSLAGVTETIQVTGEAITSISQDQQRSTTVAQSTLEALPLARTQINAVALTAGVQTSGIVGTAPSISGAQTWENSYQVNGVDVTDNVRKTANTLFIEDAIEETTTSTSGISAEYGRFSGGVVNTITKSGGNEFSGSLRDNLTNQDWNSTNRFSAEPLDKIQSVYEGTFGGRIIRDRLWFFLAGRSLKNDAVATTQLLNLPYTNSNDQKRYEGKLTFSPSANHRITGSYIKIEQDQVTGHGGLTQYLVDLSGLHTRSLPQDLTAVNYSGVLTPSFLLEAQYSARTFSFAPAGGSDASLDATPIFDLGNGIIYNAPVFCETCPNAGDDRDNKEYLAKVNYFLSTAGAGSHDIVAGADLFDDIRTSNNFQSANSFFFLNFDSQFVNDVVYPVIEPGNYVAYYPILSTSKGTHFKTNSLFVNDRWRLNDKLSFGLGVRYDKNDGKDAEGKKVAQDSAFSPRVGVTFTPDAAGAWVFNASFGRYVAAIANGVADSSSAAGSPASFYWIYDGPSFNTPGQALTPTRTALAQAFAWFNSIGGINAFPDGGSSIPGGSLVVGDGLTSTSADEFTVGGLYNMGSRGSIRADYVHREYGNFYVTRRDGTCPPGSPAGCVDGIVEDASGNPVDLGVQQNNDSLLERKYDAIQTSFNFRLADSLSLGGNYTYSKAQGNTNGETGGSGPVTDAILSYPEYKDFDRFQPNGYLTVDQRNRARVWLIWDAFKSERQHLAISMLQSYFSGNPYQAVGSITIRPYVVNPGYVAPPTSVNYYFSDRGEYRTDNITSTDLGLNYSFYIGKIELFAQADITNVLNEDGVVNVNSTILTSRNAGSGLVAFNPFTETPVEGVNWRKGPNFGKALSVNDLQAPRTYNLSLGIRF